MIEKHYSPNFITLKNDIDTHEKLMYEWWDALQETYIAEWVFLLTLACWGVTNLNFQVAGFMIGAVFFFTKFSVLTKEHKYSTRTESKFLNQLRQAKISDEERILLHKKLHTIRKKRSFFNNLFIIKKTWKIITAYMFFSLSFIVVVFPFFNVPIF